VTARARTPGQVRGLPQSLTVLVPVYNERATLRPAIDRLLAAKLPLPMDVLLVDDGSVDGSLELVQDLVEQGRIRTITHPSNLGKGAALRTGFESAEGDLVTVLDSDLEYDPNDLALLIKAVAEDGAQVVYGKRSFSSHTAFSFWYVMGNKAIALWASFLFNAWLSDVETCFKLAWKDIWLSLDLTQKGFGIEAEATGKFLRLGYRIHEVPIKYLARGREEGKKLHWTDGVEALFILLRIRLLGG
jgi:dolichol-phosphate hexosyltransferase